MSDIIGLLKKGVKSQKKVYIKYCENNYDNELTYKKFKRENIEILKFKEYLLKMDKFEYLKKSEVNNIFNYLTFNLRYHKYSEIKNLISIISDIKEKLKLKINELNEDEKCVFDCIKHVLYHFNMLEKVISAHYNMEINQLNNVIKFEELVKEILKPGNINDVLILIFDNLELLNGVDHKGRTFNDLLFDAIVNAKLNNHKVQLDYYKKLCNYILNMKSLNLDRKSIMDIFDINNYSFINKNALEEKINLLEYNSLIDRYILNDDFIVSIDNGDTKKIDDALSIERTNYGSYILGIHITDAYSLGLFASEILNNNKESINKIKASLEEFQKKNSISMFIEISDEGIIKDYKLLKTRIEVDRNLLYDDVAKILSSECSNKELLDTIINLTELYNVIENDKLSKFPTISSMAHLIVTKFMLLYGCIISEYFYNNNIPGIYMNGDESNIKYSLDRSLYDAGFTNYETYSKSTSPIYDKSSLLCQFLIHECLFNNVREERKNAIYYGLKPIVDKMNRKKE